MISVFFSVWKIYLTHQTNHFIVNVNEIYEIVYLEIENISKEMFSEVMLTWLHNHIESHTYLFQRITYCNKEVLVYWSPGL